MNVHNYSFWEDYENLLLEDKLLESPEQVVEYVNQINDYEGLPTHSKKVKVNSLMMEFFRKSLEAIPKNIKEKVNRYILGIFVIKNLGSSGATDYVYDQGGGEFKGGFILIDQSIFLNKDTLSQWLTFRLNTALKSKLDSTNYSVTIDADLKDSLSGLYFLLLHEFGHILEAINYPDNQSLSFKECLNKLSCAKNSIFDFYKLSWLDYNESIYDKSFTERSNVSFYDYRINDKLDIKLFPSVFKKWHGTDFPSIYSMLNASEDYAESLSLYIHTKTKGYPYQMIFKSNQVPLIYFTNFFGERLKAKESYFDEYFKNDS